MKTFKYLILLCLCSPWCEVEAAIDFDKDIKPIFEANCIKCHGPDKQKSGFRVDQRAVMLKGGDTGLKSVFTGDPAKSHLTCAFAAGRCARL